MPRAVAFLLDPLHVLDLSRIQLVSSMAQGITMKMSMLAVNKVQVAMLLQTAPQLSDPFEHLGVAPKEADEGIDFGRSVEGSPPKTPDFRSK
mmetsp:Transcript_36648/g.100829  ORF Transcript_36648/g.100829 Transcript_36648/m.100829 type:complete len:92 (-) Transcript_36648:106-381(-)